MLSYVNFRVISVLLNMKFNNFILFIGRFQILKVMKMVQFSAEKDLRS